MTAEKKPIWQRATEAAMAACLAVMSLAVFVNIVLRCGFGSGVAAWRRAGSCRACSSFE